MTRNPKLDVPMAAAFCLASVATCFAMGWSLAGYLYERLHRAT